MIHDPESCSSRREKKYGFMTVHRQTEGDILNLLNFKNLHRFVDLLVLEYLLVIDLVCIPPTLVLSNTAGKENTILGIITTIRLFFFY